MPSDSQPEWPATSENGSTSSLTPSLSAAPSLSDWLNKKSATSLGTPPEQPGFDALPSLESLGGSFTAQAIVSEPSIAPTEALPVFPTVEPIPTPFASLPTIEALTGESADRGLLTDGFGGSSQIASDGGPASLSALSPLGSESAPDLRPAD